MGGQDGIVWFDDSGGDLWGWVDSELKLGLLTVVDGQTFHQQGSETGAGTTTEAVEDEETLETGTLIGQFTDSVQNQIDQFLTNGVVTTSVVVGGIFLAGDKLFRVEQLAVSTGTDLIDDGWFQIDEDSTGDVLASSSLAEEGVEGVVTTTNGLVTWHLTIGLDTVLQTVQFPAGITDLDTGLTNVD